MNELLQDTTSEMNSETDCFTWRIIDIPLSAFVYGLSNVTDYPTLLSLNDDVLTNHAALLMIFLDF